MVTADLPRELKELVAWRNIIIYRHLSTDHRRLYEDSKSLGNVVEEFEKQVISYIKKRQGRI